MLAGRVGRTGSEVGSGGNKGWPRRSSSLDWKPRITGNVVGGGVEEGGFILARLRVMFSFLVDGWILMCGGGLGIKLYGQSSGRERHAMRLRLLGLSQYGSVWLDSTPLSNFPWVWSGIFLVLSNAFPTSEVAVHARLYAIESCEAGIPSSLHG